MNKNIDENYKPDFIFDKIVNPEITQVEHDAYVNVYFRHIIDYIKQNIAKDGYLFLELHKILETDLIDNKPENILRLRMCLDATIDKLKYHGWKVEKCEDAGPYIVTGFQSHWGISVPDQLKYQK